MPPHLLPSLLLSLFAVGYTPGPANIYSLSCSLAHGRKAAMKAWTGLLCGFLTAATIAACLAHFAGMAMGSSITYIKYAGAAYILYLAWKTYRSSIAENSDIRCGFWNGFIVQMTNAKMILFDLTVFSTFVLPYSDRFADLLLMIPFLMIAGPGGNIVWLLAGSFLKPHLEKHQRAVDTVMALALAACTIRILM